jgi:hypothetical protein
MKLLILNLSDIHIRSENDPVLSRRACIAHALRSLETTDVNALVCLICGDTVFSGTEEQFDIALDYYANLKTELEKELTPLKVHYVMVPGNHDCDFSETTAVRESVLRSISEKNSLLQDRSLLDVCLEPLKRFFDFQKAVVDLPFEHERDTAPGIVWEHNLLVGSKSARFVCCNTALMSTLHEKAGQLHFPISFLPEDRSDDAVVISVFHHPVNWLDPNCSRAFRKRVEAISDMVITGHEHVVESRKTTSTQGDATYYECGALQENHDPTASEFSVLILNLETKQRLQILFRWEDTRYLPLNGENPEQLYLWQGFSQNSYRIRKSFRVLPDFGEWLNDTEVGLQHRVRGHLTLDDVYVYPDLRRVKQVGETGREVVKSRFVADLPLEKPSLFILGDDESGKTALAKRFFSHLRSKGDVPVYIDFGKEKLSSKTCVADIESAFLRCYDASALDSYRQLEKGRRVVIIDNYHKGRLEPKRRHALLEAVRNHSYRVIIFAHDAAVTFYDLSETSLTERPFAFYSILPFSISQQNKVIEKWLLLSEDADSDTAPFVANLERLRAFMKTIFGKNYVNPYPPYLLAILQANESGTDLDLKANTHGYFYELFIRNLIAKHSKSSISMGILTAYLAQVAYRMYSCGSRQISSAEFRKLHIQLQEEFEVIPDFNGLADQLVAMQLLQKKNDCFRFKQSFIYYYFLAMFLHQNIDREPYASGVREVIRTLSCQLYKEESASTLLFLCHLSHDIRILEGLLAVCDAQFPDASAARLEQDVQFVNCLRGTIDSISIPDVPLAERRAHEIEREELQRDEEIEYEEQNQRDLESGDTILGRLNASIKTIQILGQFLKNFPATLRKDEKDKIIDSASRLAARILGDCFGRLAENQSQAVKEMITLISRNRPGLSQEKLRDKAINALVVLSELAALGIITRLANSLGAVELAATFERYFESSQGTFGELTHFSIKLEHNEAFPEAFLDNLCRDKASNPFVMRVIQCLVIRRSLIFPIEYDLKQKLAQKLNLKYFSLSSTEVDQRLLPRK